MMRLQTTSGLLLDEIWDGESGYESLEHFNSLHPAQKRPYYYIRIDDAKIKRRLIRERGKKCEECSTELLRKEIEMHHIIPVSKGGTSADENLQLLCHKCHLKHRGGK